MVHGTRGEHTSQPLRVRADQPYPSQALAGAVDASGLAATARTTVVGSVAGLRSLRRTLATWLTELGIAVEAFAADVQLVIVEVVTNSFVHGQAESVSVSLAVERHEIVDTTQHRSSVEASSFPARQPRSPSVSGDGLFIGDQVACERLVSHSRGESTTTLLIPVSAETLPEKRMIGTGTDA